MGVIGGQVYVQRLSETEGHNLKKQWPFSLDQDSML